MYVQGCIQHFFVGGGGGGIVDGVLASRGIFPLGRCGGMIPLKILQ